MKALIQRVNWAEVIVDRQIVGRIEAGLLLFLGIGRQDKASDVPGLVEKILNLRIFSNAEGKFDHSLLDTKGSLLVVSQFTLMGECSKGRRPNFQDAAPPEQAHLIYEATLDELRRLNVPHASGQFQAAMDVRLSNDGPVTLMLEHPRSLGVSLEK